MTRTLGAAVLGLGVGEQHARAYARADGCVLRWLHDLDRGKAQRLAIELSTEAANSYEQLLTDEGVDIVSIATFDDAHAGHVAEALRARKHVFVEKPLCRSREEAKTIKDLWLASGGR